MLRRSTVRIKPGGRVGSGPRVEFMQSPGWRQAGERTCPGGGAEAQMQSTQHKQMNTCTRARRHAPTHARRHARRHAGRHAYMHTHSLSLTHTHTNKQTNTCTHTQAQIRRKTQRKHLRTIARALKDVLAHLRTSPPAHEQNHISQRQSNCAGASELIHTVSG